MMSSMRSSGTRKRDLLRSRFHFVIVVREVWAPRSTSWDYHTSSMSKASSREQFVACIADLQYGRIAIMKIEELIERNPEKLGGTPVFPGTRVPIKHLFDYLNGGDGIETFLLWIR